MNEKLEKFFSKAKTEKAILLNAGARNPNFFYFSELPFGLFDNSLLLLKKGRKPLLLASALELCFAKKQKHLRVKALKKGKQLQKLLKKEFSGKKIGFDAVHLSIAGKKQLLKHLKGKKLVNESKAFALARQTKTKKELRHLRKAVQITETALKKVPGLYKKGMTEIQLANALESKAKSLGADAELAFQTIAASGKNASTPHHVTGNKRIGKGFLLVDFGCRHKNYCADLTRMFFVGKAGKKQKHLYESVLKAQTEAKKTALPGVKAKQLFFAAEKALKKELKMRQLHGLGHGLGLEAHDFPKGIGAKSSWQLKKGMVLSLEPAVYGKWGGIRIEDDFVATRKGLKALSRAPQKLVEIKF